MKPEIANTIFRKEVDNELNQAIRSVFVIPNKKNHQTTCIPLQLEFSGFTEDASSYLLVNPWISVSLHSRVSGKISFIEEGLPLPISLGRFKNGSGGILKGNPLLWETKIHLTLQLIDVMEKIYDPQFGAELKLDWGVTALTLDSTQKTFAENWCCRLRIVPNKWQIFSSLWT